MTRRLIRAGAAGVVALAASGLAVLSAVPANAAVIGSLAFSPASGTDTTAITVTTSGTCPTGATNLIATVTGTGFPAAGQVAVANIAIASVPQSGGGYQLPLAGAMRDLANLQSPPAQLSGNYTFTVTCRTAFNPASLGDFTGAINFTSNTTYAPVQGAVTTATVLTASPANTAPANAQVTLTATVTPTPAGTVTGTVQFMDGATTLGTPQPVDAGGVATLSTTLAVGAHSLSAAFTGAGANIGNSTSAAVPYTSTTPVATATTTGLAASPTTADNLTNVVLDATVGPANAAGSVTFFNNGTAQVGSVPVTSGHAVLTRTYPAGAYSFTASFVPADATVFGPSTSLAVPYTVTQSAAPSASETVNTTVAPGTLTISVANTAPVVLPAPVLNAAATMLTTGGDINPVTLTDTRAGNPGWTVSGQISDFAGPGTASINGGNLGWTPKVVDNGAGQTVTAGSVVGAAAGIAPGAVPDVTLGLRSARTLAQAASAHGIGTAHLSATLALNVPTTTVAGTYSATLTLTAI